jgi:D-alanyl-lipoteichoic acid acyltransferase DltB (MBOAT superfamily)
MLFNSLGFIVFLPAVFFLYWALPGRLRPWLLLLASIYFYMAFVPKYILILFFLITVDFFLGRKIAASSGHIRRIYFILSIISNIGMLFIFKYFNFFNENITALASFLHWNYSMAALSLILPLGLSFHVFQSLSYIIEVYRGNYPAEKNYMLYALYVMFFPQLVAGPIERPAHMLPQLKATQVFDYGQTVSGLQLILWGFFKKVAVADNLGVSVDYIYKHIGTADSSVILLALFGFSMQLYCDFSGYTDIARGSARMLGIDLMLNFNQPYFSKSVAEFWRRWHISLSSWFRDYVYIPLGGNRVGIWKYYRNILIVFAITGFWHGAAWTFVIMGFLFGSYIAVGHFSMPVRKRITAWIGLDHFPTLHNTVQVIITFVLVSIAWVFFRAQDLAQALSVIGGLFTRWGHGAFQYLSCATCTTALIGIDKKELIIIFVSVLILLWFELLAEKKITLPAFLTRRVVRWPAYYALILWMLFAGYFAAKTFIYFQF